MYKLSKTFYGHQADVRGLAASSDAIVSCSRDGTLRWWNWSTKQPETVFASTTNSFINCVAYLPHNPDLIASGGKDNVIFINSIHDRDCDMGQYNLVGHQNNICSVHYSDNLLISSSWDATARVWDTATMSQKYVLQHPASVLDSKVVGPELFLTCCADRVIRLWDHDKVARTFVGHSDVVRKLLVIAPELFASCSNDASIKIWNIESGSCINTLTGHDSFIYDLVLLPNGLLVSCGEDRSVRIWRDFKLVQTITLPCISNWCVTAVDNDIVVGGSDSLIRAFTSNPEHFAPSEELEAFEEAVKSSTISEQSLDINKTDVPGYDRLSQPGNEGQTVMVKSPAGIIEAHQWSNNQWNKIGDVVSSATSGGKQTYNGKEYDYVFDVDIEDGKPPLKLPYNVNDNPYTAAQKFLADNELPNSYADEVVRFIQKNTEGFKIEEKTEPSTAAASDETSGAPKSVQLSIIPVSDYIFFEEINFNQLNKGFSKFNDASDVKVYMFDAGISSADTCEFIFNDVKTIFDKGSHLLAFDLLRALILKVNMTDILKRETLPELILGFINIGLESNDATLLMMLLKFLTNLVNSVLFLQIYITEEKGLAYSALYEALVDTLIKKLAVLDQQHKHYNLFLVSLATFVFNCSVFQLKKKLKSSALAQFFNQTYASEEAAYRTMVAYGNLRYNGCEVPKPRWIDQYSGKRFTDLAADLSQL